MAIKKTLLQIVQSILSDMDSTNVNSIGDSAEALQVARIVEKTFYNIVATRDVPELNELIKLTAASNSETPTHFKYPENTKKIIKVWYENDDGYYKEVDWCDPVDFVYKTDLIVEDYDTVLDVNAGTNLRIKNTKNPTFYTSFDDENIVMNSYNSAVDSTLQSSKVRAFGSKLPVFNITDDFVPPLDPVYFPYLINEATSVSMSLLKGGSDPKVEQAARRQKSYIQNDRYTTERKASWVNYGRK